MRGAPPARTFLLVIALLGPSVSALASATVVKRKPLDEAAIAAALDPSKPSDQPVIAARKAAADEPQSLEARIKLGNAYLSRAWVPEALVAFTEASELDPDSSIAWNNIGITQELQEDGDRARSAFERAVKLDPRNAEAHYNLATSYERARNFDAAVRHFREALRLRPVLGDPIANPRASQAGLLLPTRISLYLEVSGSRTLPPQRPDGQLDLGNVLSPDIIASPLQMRTEQAPDGGRQLPAGEAQSTPVAPVAPTPAPTPIQLGPGSVGASAARPTPPLPRGTNPGEPRVRVGRPLPPKPTPVVDE
jgi:Flp pilus assembly protein TadD